MITQQLLNYRAYSTILIINYCIAERAGLSKDMRCRNVFVMHGGGARNVSGTSLQINRTDKRNMKRTLLLIAVIVIISALPVNYGMSAILVPAGTHEVEFRFVTRGLMPGLAISLLALAVLLLLFMAERRYAIAQCITHNHIGNDV